jgi:hypothetical protein
MDNPKPDLPEPEDEPKPKASEDAQPKSQPTPETESGAYVNEKIGHAYKRAKIWFGDAGESYRRHPRLQKVIYQGKFLPAFWTVAGIFSLVVNIILIAVLVSFGHYFFELKTLVSEGLVSGMSDSLALMDKAHIVMTVPVETTVQLQDNLPVVFDLSINENTQVNLAEDTRIPGAYIYLNNTAVLTDLDLPAGTPLNFTLNTTIPVSQSIPVDVTVPVSLLVPLDVAIDQTDLHQSIVGMQSAIEPYRSFLGSTFNSPKEIMLCKQWWASWLCTILFGNQ